MSEQGHLGPVLSALLDGELSAAEAASAQAHLAQCARCASELATVATTRHWVQELPAVDPPFGFYERLLLRQPVFSRRRRHLGVGALAAGAVASVALVSLATPSEQQVSPSVAQLVETHAASASVSGDPLSQLVSIGVPVTFVP